jgi:chemotaxis protein methyltransferase CheR
MRDEECVAFLQWALPRLGLRWHGFRRVRRQVCKRISRRMATLGLPDAAAYRARLEADPAEWSVLDTYCWISVSRFYRDRGVFEDLGGAILPELARAAIARDRRALRAWSAGCASGEEPYSLRLAWDLAVAPALPGAELHILATDASPALLARAKRAVYAGSGLKELPAAWRSSAFDGLDGSYRLRKEFRRGVRFRQQDIRKAMPAGPFDLVLCRNLVFTYFEPDLQRAILGRLMKRLVPGGALLVGSHEALPEPAALLPSGGTPGLYRAPHDSPA